MEMVRGTISAANGRSPGHAAESGGVGIGGLAPTLRLMLATVVRNKCTENAGGILHHVSGEIVSLQMG